jgi:arsenite-transporting ATPase
LSLVLPFTTREEINMSQNGDEIFVQVRSYRRNIMLPRALLGLPITGARFKGSHLKIRFETDRESTTGGVKPEGR